MAQLHQSYNTLNDLIGRVQDSSGNNLTKMKEQLKDSLGLSSNYALGLKTIQDQKHTLNVNALNQEKLVRELKFPAYLAIAEWVEQTYRPQIEADYNSLAPILPTIDTLTRTIEGLINLEQTESDRQLDRTIQAFGTGVAVASVTAAVVSTQVRQPDPAKKWDIAFFDIFIALLFSLGFGYLVALGVAWFIRDTSRH